MAAGGVLVLLIIHWLNIWRLFICTGFIIGMLSAAAFGFVLGWPLMIYLKLTDTKWVWIPAAAGAAAFIIFLISYYRVSLRTSSRPSDVD